MGLSDLLYDLENPAPLRNMQPVEEPPRKNFEYLIYEGIKELIVKVYERIKGDYFDR